MRHVLAGSILVLAMSFPASTPARAASLAETSAAMGVNNSAAAAGASGASTAHAARDTITRHLPDGGGEGWAKAGQGGSHAAGGAGGWAKPAGRTSGAAGWGKGSEGWAARGGARR
jgi:hypothetical protein